MFENGKIDELTESLKSYATTNYKLIRLEAIERSSVIGSSLIGAVILGIAGFLFVLFTSIGAGYYFSQELNSYYMGFGIVAGFYLVLCIILAIGRKSLLEKPLRDKIIRKVLGTN